MSFLERRFVNTHYEHCATSKPLGQSRKDRATNAELRRADANSRAIADFVDRVADIQNIEAKFRPLPGSSFWTMLALTVT
jgi:hypothetical protein